MKYLSLKNNDILSYSLIKIDLKLSQEKESSYPQKIIYFKICFE